jgi:nucleoside-diphosphate-sugar epimerase
VRALITGATGFIGGRVARALVARGWDVVALVRSPERAGNLREMGVSLVGGDVTEPATLSSPMRRCDAVFHLAAWYAIGAADRQRMWTTNVGGTENVLEEAAVAGVPRIVYCSSIAALGRGEPGEIRDESSVHPGVFPSSYEETKWRAHLLARELAGGGLPIVTVMPGAVYGPGDPSVLGVLLRYYARGWLVAFPRTTGEFSWVYVEDVAEGIVKAFEKGRDGEEYCLGGENFSINDLLEHLEPVTGIRAPRFELPQRIVQLSRPIGPLLARMMGQEPRFLEEGIASMSGSYMMSSDKATKELGYTFRPAEEGFGETVRWLKEH